MTDVTTAPVQLDEHQQRVVERVAVAGHGPLLVLAGPGTGKTTTLVEAIAARVEAGTTPEQILTLTFSRRAAGDLRSRIARRLQRTVAAPLAWTFHGFGYSLIGEQLAPDDLGRSLRLLSGSEQEVIVRDLLSFDRQLGTVAWPAQLDAALKTRGFTEQVRTFMGTARSLGLAPDQIRSLNPERPDWAALSTFMTEYLDVIDSQGLLDYSELVSRAVAYAESPEGQRRLRDRYQLVLVDEYQDTDPAQERLLKAIAGDGRDLVAVGDPDQSIYAFRGADVRGITEFVDRFRSPSNGPGEILTLRTSRRCAIEITSKSRKVAALLGSAGSIPAADLKQHRQLVLPEGHVQGSVEVRLFPTAEREAAAIAEVLRREHLHWQTPWSQMAVLVRSGTTSIPGLQRALTIAGVPVEVALDELPLRDHPTIAPLVMILEYAARPGSLTSERVHELLLSPLVGASASDIRRLGRTLRTLERERGVHDPEPSSELIRETVLDPRRSEGVAQSTSAPVWRLAELLASVRQLADDGRSAHELLWSVWNGSVWSRRLIGDARGSGPTAASANRALDAIVSLFDMAARSRDRSTRSDLRTFLAELAAQEIPAGTLDDVGVLGAGVRVMTAHRSKGLQWEVVVVAGVQADAWPDLRRRGSVIDSDLLGSDGLRVPATIADLRRDERRLFYVAITRARRRVVCTAVQAPADDGARPSPFLQDLEIEPVYETDTVRHPLTLSGVVAGLRRELADDGATPAFRRELATRLAALGTPGADGKPVISAADPEQWWGLREATGATTVALDGDQPLELHLSGSQIEMLQRCPLQWYLTRRVKAETSRGTAAGFGGVLHALADAVARKELPAEVDALARALDDIWSQLPYTAAWEAGQEHDAAVAAIERFLEWHSRARDRELVATEAAFEQTFTIFDVSVHLSGRVDRLERDGDGLVVVDFKTSRSQRASKDVASDLQLATYRRLVAAQYDTSPSKVAAELVQLRVPERKNAPGPKVQEHDASAETDEALQRALERAVTLVSKGEFPAVPNKACSYCQFSLTCPAQPAGREVVS